MYFKQILDERNGCASYVIASRDAKEAAIVDPAITTEQYDQLLAERQFTLRYVIDTHIHADHVSGARKLAAAHGADLCLYESAKVNYPFRPLHDGEELALGQLVLRIMHTPGHRPELMSILIVNPERSPEPSMVLTGDSLLVGDVGRPDFGGGNAADQFASVTRLFRLPDWVGVFPGHFEGPCGKGMCGRPSTTIGFERLYNPTARLERAPFIERLGEGTPARPLNMAAIEATNLGAADFSWTMLTSSPNVREISVDDLARREEPGMLVDVREPEEYDGGHVPGAINVPQADLAVRLEELPHDRPLYVICRSGARSLRAAQFLFQVGFDNVVSVAGGTVGWQDSNRPIEGEGATAARIVESSWAHAGVNG
jgi:glyoxylase-like metal-dependent hydrolase (beta-lactamase superfamily II)/rhodanese-related sulfurtransferase